MHFIQTHKKESILIGIAIVFFIALLLFLKIFFFSGGGNVYGDRFSDIEKVKVSKDKLEMVKDALLEKDGIEKANVYVIGRIIQLFIEVNSASTLDDLKNVATASIENFSTKEQELYDIQIYFVGEGETYPAIGYRGKGGTVFTWVNS